MRIDLIDIKSIKNILLERSNSKINFPKKVSFQFPDFYKDLITQLKTTEISAECILFGSVESVNQTKEFYNPEYWNTSFEIEKMNNYWFFGANGQGDLWVLHNKNEVLFYDHNQGEMSQENFIPLELNFEKWLQFAFLNQQFEELAYHDKLTEELKAMYKSKLIQLSSKLFENYPFLI